MLERSDWVEDLVSGFSVGNEEGITNAPQRRLGAKNDVHMDNFEEFGGERKSIRVAAGLVNCSCFAKI